MSNYYREPIRRVSTSSTSTTRPATPVSKIKTIQVRASLSSSASPSSHSHNNDHVRMKDTKIEHIPIYDYKHAPIMDVLRIKERSLLINETISLIQASVNKHPGRKTHIVDYIHYKNSEYADLVLSQAGVYRADVEQALKALGFKMVPILKSSWLTCFAYDVGFKVIDVRM